MASKKTTTKETETTNPAKLSYTEEEYGKLKSLVAVQKAIDDGHASEKQLGKELAAFIERNRATLEANADGVTLGEVRMRIKFSERFLVEEA